MASPGPDDLACLAPDEQWVQVLREVPRHLLDLGQFHTAFVSKPNKISGA